MAKAPTPAQTAAKEEEKWRAESDLRTLIDAEKIKADSKRMKAAMQIREEQAKALRKLKDTTSD